MSAVIHRTAQQLGVPEDFITLGTIIPDIKTLATFVAIDVAQNVEVRDPRANYTVERAIEELEDVNEEE